jgi:hypothetical protein
VHLPIQHNWPLMLRRKTKAKRIIVDSVKDHFIPHTVDKLTEKLMCEAFISLYQSSCVSRQMLLQNKLSTIHISKTDIVVSYLARITKSRDQFHAIRIVVEDKESVSIALNGLVVSWRPFV